MRSLFVFAANKTGESLVCHPMTAEGRIYIILSQDGYRSQKIKTEEHNMAKRILKEEQLIDVIWGATLMGGGGGGAW